MTTVVAVQVVTVSMCRWQSTEHSFFALVFGFFAYKIASPNCVREMNDSRYEQFEISAETIEQELTCFNHYRQKWTMATRLVRPVNDYLLDLISNDRCKRCE